MSNDRRFRRFAAWLPLVAAVLIAGATTLGANGEPTRMLRSPAVSATHIAFAYAQNIWVVERAGGAARRLTSFQGQAGHPRFSPDGRTIAFTGDYAGNADVYVVPVEGGEPVRLTWHPGADTVQGWTPDGTRVLFSSGRATWAPVAAPRFWTVPAAGGVAEPMALPRGYQGRLSPDGRHIAYRMNNSWDEERRNYRGGQNKPIWIVDLKTYDLVSPPWTDSKDIEPVWVGGDVYFLSDRDGVSNIWRYQPATKALTQVTRFTDFDVKTLDGRADAVVFEQGGQVHELDPATGQSRVVSIRATGDFPWMMPRWEDVTARMTNIRLSATGQRVVVESRGEIFTIPAEKGDVRNITRSSASAERQPAWSPDGQWVSYFSDRSGEYRLMIAPQDGIAAPREVALPDPDFYYTPAWSPDSTKLLYTDTNLQVWVLDVATGQARVLGNDPWMVPQRTLNPAWSPDSKWIAYATRLDTLYRAIVIANVETGERRQVTDGLADAMFPVWDASGKYLWFLASTDYGLRSQWLDMTSYDRPQTFALYLAVLKKGEPSPLLPESDEDKGIPVPAAAPAAAPAPEAPAAPVTVAIDFDGFQQRVLAVAGVPERLYSQLAPGVAGSVYFLEAPPRPNMGSTLHRFKLTERRATLFVDDVAEYSVSADGKKLLYRTPTAGGATAAPPALFLVDADKPPTAGQGRLSATLRMHLDPKAEFQQIFDEGWRLQRDFLYVENMHGTDWPAMKRMYGPLLPHVMHRADLTYLLDMMGGEIAVGHSYVRGGALPDVPAPLGGLLGADFTVESGRYKIARIYDAESWNPDLRAPFSAPGLDVAVGDFVLAIDGAPLAAPDSLHRLLDGTANRQTVLTVNRRPVMDGARQVTVVPVANDQGLRTRAWVEENRRIVDRLSQGRLAYVYVPNTGQPGYTSFNRYYFAQQDKAGAVIDERFNGGGSAADYIIDVLQRDFDGYFNNVAGDRRPFTSPSAGIWGPKVMIINEMAGSGGDLMPYMFKRRGIGPLIGTRTWGGLVHTADTPVLIDGGTMIAPRGGFFTRDGQWAVENEGVGADIEVENWPKDVVAGGDPQLERAVQEALRRLEEAPVDRRTTEPAPPTWGARPRPGGQ
ncbi:MAG: PDZ domain-containing protein [Vicinamibacterales bacterium]|nr:PDZ domain-containing protein [Vicinamibacterales bacterium]